MLPAGNQPTQVFWVILSCFLLNFAHFRDTLSSTMAILWGFRGPKFVDLMVLCKVCKVCEVCKVPTTQVRGLSRLNILNFACLLFAYCLFIADCLLPVVRSTLRRVSHKLPSLSAAHLRCGVCLESDIFVIALHCGRRSYRSAWKLREELLFSGGVFFWILDFTAGLPDDSALQPASRLGTLCMQIWGMVTGDREGLRASDTPA